MAGGAEKRIAVIGGGIGGIAAAVALHRFGFRAVVFERAAQLREVGVGMMLWPNATRVLREMGILDKVLACSAANTHFLVRASSGKILMDIALGKFEVPAVCTSRADLLKVLRNALPPGAIQLGSELDHFTQVRGKVRIYFKKNRIEEFDAMIGADGIRSRVRGVLFGPAEPVYRGYTVWRGIAQYRGSAPPLDYNSESWGWGKRFGILHTGHGRITWYATANVPASHVDAAEGRKRELQRMFARWHEPIPTLLSETNESEILKHGARDCTPLRHWSKGLITLLGDAAHPCTPNLGQGGCMALEDALVLAKCLAKEAHLRRGLLLYERRRLRRTRHIQQRSLFMGYIGQWQSPLFVTGRRIVTQMIPAALIERNLRRVYAYTT